MKLPSALRVLQQPVRPGHNSRTSVGQGAAITAVGIAASGAARFITNTIIGRAGGPALLGLTQSALSLTQLFALFLPSTMSTTASKFMARSRGAGRVSEAEAIARYLSRRLLVVATLLACAAAVVWRIFYSASTLQVALVASMTLLFSTYTFCRGMQYGTGQIVRATLWEIVLACIGLAGVIVLASAGRRDLSLLLPMLLGYFLYTLASWSRGSHKELEPAVRREMRAFIALAIGGTLVSAGFLQSTVLVARASGGLRLAGEFAAALTLATPVSMIATAISLATFPAMAEAWAHNDDATLKRHLDQATRLLLVVMAGAIGTLALLSSTLADVVWGGEFDDVELILPLLLLAAFLRAVAVPSVNLLMSRNNRGMATSAVASALGLIFGIGTWATMSRAGVSPSTLIPTGYVVGVVIQTGIPVGLAWRSHMQVWLAPFAKAAVWLALSATLIVLEHHYAWGWQVMAALSLAYVLPWLALHRAELVHALEITRPRYPRNGEGSIS